MNHTTTSSSSSPPPPPPTPSSTTSSSASQQLQQQQQQSDSLMEQYGINTISLFADIHNAIVDSTADFLEILEDTVKAIHNDYCHRKGIHSEQIAQEQDELTLSFDNVQIDSAKETAVSVDMAEIFAAKTAFAVREYMDSNVIKSIYGDLTPMLKQQVLTDQQQQQQQSPDQQQQQDAPTSSQHVVVDEEQIDREILELRRKIQHVQRRNQLLIEEGKRLDNEMKFYEQNIEKFNFLEQIQKGEGIESWEKLVTDLVNSGKTLHQRIIESKKHHQESDAMEIDEQLTVPSAFNAFSSTTSITYSTGGEDLNQLKKFLDSK